MADFLDAKVREIEARLQQLQPLIEEFHRLEAASAALSSVRTGAAGGSSAASANGNARRGRPRRRQGETTRAAQTVELVQAQPGITIPELAVHMGIKPNYLYRVLPQLADEGRVRRAGKGWHPA